MFICTSDGWLTCIEWDPLKPALLKPFQYVVALSSSLHFLSGKFTRVYILKYLLDSCASWLAVCLLVFFFIPVPMLYPAVVFHYVAFYFSIVSYSAGVRARLHNSTCVWCTFFLCGKKRPLCVLTCRKPGGEKKNDERFSTNQFEYS